MVNPAPVVLSCVVAKHGHAVFDSASTCASNSITMAPLPGRRPFTWAGTSAAVSSSSTPTAVRRWQPPVPTGRTRDQWSWSLGREGLRGTGRDCRISSRRKDPPGRTRLAPCSTSLRAVHTHHALLSFHATQELGVQGGASVWRGPLPLPREPGGLAGVPPLAWYERGRRWW